jgi:hypothetical protein
VWELLDPPRTEVELSALSAREFDLDRATTIAALAALSEAGLCHAT